MSVARGARQGRELDERDWATYFEELNRRLEDGAELEATIEVVARPVGAIEAMRLPLNSVTYEDGDDEIAIGLGGRDQHYPAVLWHFVDQPRRVAVRDEDDDGDAVSTIEIESADASVTLLRLYFD